MNRAVSKTVEPARVPGVRIPLSPRCFIALDRSTDYDKASISQRLGDSKRSVAVRISRREPCCRKSGTGRAGQRVGGGWKEQTGRLRLEPRIPLSPKLANGEMTERPKVHDWKSCVPGRVPRVQIPLSPKVLFVVKKLT